MSTAQITDEKLYWEYIKYEVFCICFSRERLLREGYTVKFFFQSVSWNTNLTLISQCILTLNSN